MYFLIFFYLSCPLIYTEVHIMSSIEMLDNKAEWKRLCASVAGNAVSTQPRDESQTLCNSLPLRREDVPVKSFKLLQPLLRWKCLDQRFDIVGLPRPRKCCSKLRSENVSVQTLGIESIQDVQPGRVSTNSAYKSTGLCISALPPSANDTHQWTCSTVPSWMHEVLNLCCYY